MKKFKATAHKTKNEYESFIVIKETITEENADGYIQIAGKTVDHKIDIAGKNSYKRAKILASQISGK